MFLQKLEHAEDEEGLERSQQNSEILFFAKTSLSMLKMDRV
jgi:hypothetical protein